MYIYLYITYMIRLYLYFIIKYLYIIKNGKYIQIYLYI